MFNKPSALYRWTSASGQPTPLVALGLILIVFFWLPWKAHAQCGPQEVKKLLTPDGGAYDNFGDQVAISGDVILVGAPKHDGVYPESGAAYIYRFNGYTWREETRLLPSDPIREQEFGAAVAIDSNVAVVGAREDNEKGIDAGAVYLFRYNGRAWIEEAKLFASDARPDGRFGSSVAIQDTRLLIGAYGNSAQGDYAGSAYVFGYDGSEWNEEAKLLASDGTPDDLFGISVSMDGDVAIIGALAAHGVTNETGAAYVFRIDGSAWNEEAKLIAPDGQRSDQFGTAVGISDETAVIGSPRVDGQYRSMGAVYVFHLEVDVWELETRLLPSNLKWGDNFGRSISLNQNTMVVGANGVDDNGHNSGAAFVYELDGETWTERDRLIASDGEPDDLFGHSVSMSGNTIVIGAYYDDDHGANSGSAYVFDRYLDIPRLTFDVTNLVAGEKATFTVTNGTPGEQAVVVYGWQIGRTTVKAIGGYCAVLGISSVTTHRVVGGWNHVFNADGQIAFDVLVPTRSAGAALFFQCVEQGTCPQQCISRVIERIVQ